MKTLKNCSAEPLSLTMILSLAACGGNASGGDSASGEVPVIGICQYGEHASLDNCREGFLQGLEQAGLVEGTDYTIDYQNASFDDNMAIQIAQAFSAEDVDLMVGIATPAATACYAAAEDKDIPVIFTAITDPVGPSWIPATSPAPLTCSPSRGSWSSSGPSSLRRTPSASSTPPARPTPSTPSGSMRSWPPTTASPSRPSASPPSPR